MLRFYADVHIAKEAIYQLQYKGIDAVHSSDVSMENASDEEHLNYAAQQQRIVITCDDDFEKLHWQYQQEQREHPGIIYFRMFDQCKSISIIVREIQFLHEVAEYKIDLYNKVWRVET
jgi:predicted nuclease of predicted toxin-antitoxin system